jgi:ABC-2 type transport system permease protein
MNWDQLKTILWLRWRLTRNQWRKQGGFGAVIMAIVAVTALIIGVASFVGALLGGILGLGDAKPTTIMGIWFGLTAAFLFLWTIGLLNELQRSESIDLQRLMHLPVALGQMFVVNYIASHVATSIVLLVPAMMGLAIGLTVSRSPLMLLLIPLALSMVFMITAWTYCLRGWLAAQMSNPRRRRTVIMFITFGFIMVSQAPNLYFNLLRRQANHSRTASQPATNNSDNQRKFEQFLAIQKFIPPLWVPVGAQALTEGRAIPALLGALGCFALGVAGLRRSYRSTIRFYYGEMSGKAAKRDVSVVSNAPAAPRKSGSSLVELRIPVVPEEVAALGLATFRSMLRAPEVKMAWGSSFFVTLIFGASFMMRAAPKVSPAVKPIIAVGSLVFSVFMLVQFFANQFGFDRDGFRALVLSPASRRHILLGKNLACLPVGLGFGVILLTAISFWLRLPPLSFVAGLFQLATLLILAGLIGNVLSIIVPYRIQAGSMKPTKMPGLAMVVMLLCHFLFPLVMLPVFVPPLAEMLWQMGELPVYVPVNFILSVLLAALAAFVYWQTLEPLGNLLQRRETKILSVITAEVE